MVQIRATKHRDDNVAVFRPMSTLQLFDPKRKSLLRSARVHQLAVYEVRVCTWHDFASVTTVFALVADATLCAGPTGQLQVLRARVPAAARVPEVRLHAIAAALQVIMWFNSSSCCRSSCCFV